MHMYEIFKEFKNERKKKTHAQKPKNKKQPTNQPYNATII